MLYTNRLEYEKNDPKVWAEIFRQVGFWRQDGDAGGGTRLLLDKEFMDRALTYAKQQLAVKLLPPNAFDLTIPNQCSIQWDARDQYDNLYGGCRTLTLLRRGEFRILIQTRPLSGGPQTKGRSQGWKGLVDHSLLKAVRLPEQVTCRAPLS